MIPEKLQQRIWSALTDRQEKQLLRKTSVPPQNPEFLNLADNDYLALARDPALISAAQKAAETFGCSSSSSPLISGYGPAHEELEQTLCNWHGFASGLVWNSGYTANQAVLGWLPRKGDLIFADRLIHNSMIRGILQSGARLIRFRHNDIDHLRELLQQHTVANGVRFVVTESVFSMDGDIPDLAEIATLKKEFPFCLIVDEAHATGWYGPNGNGLAEKQGTRDSIDILVGTLGKSLASQGAYTLFHDPDLREFLVNEAGEFIYSTYLSPIAAAVAQAAIGRIHDLSVEQTKWHETSRNFRERLRSNGWEVPIGDSPIVPVLIGKNSDLLSLAAYLRKQQILMGAVRPPTVPAGSSRIRFSLKRTLTPETTETIADILSDWRKLRK